MRAYLGEKCSDFRLATRRQADSFYRQVHSFSLTSSFKSSKLGNFDFFTFFPHQRVLGFSTVFSSVFFSTKTEFFIHFYRIFHYEHENFVDEWFSPSFFVAVSP